MWYEEERETLASGNERVRLRCPDCGGELRLPDTPAGREKAAQMVAGHKPSGCCEERGGIREER